MVGEMLILEATTAMMLLQNVRSGRGLAEGKLI